MYHITQYRHDEKNKFIYAQDTRSGDAVGALWRRRESYLGYLGHFLSKGGAA